MPLTLQEQTAPGTPATGYAVVYAKSDGLLYGKDDAGTETKLSNVGLGGITLGTPIATTSGTAHDFTGIPAGTRRICINMVGVSSNGTSNKLIQIGDSGGFELTGYLGASSTIGSGVSTTNYTTGFGITVGAAADVMHGTVVLELVDASAFTWVAHGVLSLSNGAATVTVSGSKSLSAELTQVRLTTVNGTDAFDAGSVNILYE